MMEAFEEGNHGVVMDEIGYKLREPAFYNSSVVNSGDEVMWRLEAGSMNFYTGNFAESVAQFKQAEALIATTGRKSVSATEERSLGVLSQI